MHHTPLLLLSSLVLLALPECPRYTRFLARPRLLTRL